MKNQTATYAIKMAVIADEQPCPGCSAPLPESPVAPIVHLNDSPVCDACARESAPVLSALVSMALLARFDFTNAWEASEASA